MDLEAICLDKEVRALKQYLSTQMAKQVYCGKNFLLISHKKIYTYME